MPIVHAFLDSLARDRTAWIVSTTVSVVLYTGIAVAIPVVLARLPPDFFARPPRRHGPFLRVLRFLAGLVVAGAGVAMLFLPGPGILTILLGLTIMGGDLAARGVRRLVGRPRVLDAINAVRAKRSRPPLQHPDDSR